MIKFFVESIRNCGKMELRQREATFIIRLNYQIIRGKKWKFDSTLIEDEIQAWWWEIFCFSILCCFKRLSPSDSMRIILQCIITSSFFEKFWSKTSLMILSPFTLFSFFLIFILLFNYYGEIFFQNSSVCFLFLFNSSVCRIFSVT